MMTEANFSRTIRSIRERPREDLLFIWCNVIRFLDLCFLQGQLWKENDPAGTYRPIAALVDTADPIEPDGFWPSITAHPWNETRRRCWSPTCQDGIRTTWN